MGAMHATCQNIHRRGSLRKGDRFKTICGKEVILDPNDREKCPECEKLFGEYLTGEPCPLCGLSGLEHDAQRMN
jgi:hypothetical protein